MLSSKLIKEAALAAGADVCGIAPIERMKGAPDLMNPKFLFPECRSMIGFVFRIPRGVQRGIEEGTQFYQYPSMAYGGINEIYGPAVLYAVGRVIEDEGYEAFVYRNTGARGAVSDMDGKEGSTTSPEDYINRMGEGGAVTKHHRKSLYTRKTREENVEPDLQFQFRLAAVACGLGEIGWSKMLLTPQFGPLQRVVFMFTDGEFDEYDEMYSGKPLCRRCGACVRECPGGCIPPIGSEKTVRVDLDGKICEWGDIDMWRCYAFYSHAGRYYNPFVPKEVFDKNENGVLDLLERPDMAGTEETSAGIHEYMRQFLPNAAGYGLAKCGGCIRGCVSMLEKKGGCMENRFKEPLRTRKTPWKLDR